MSNAADRRKFQEDVVELYYLNWLYAQIDMSDKAKELEGAIKLAEENIKRRD